MFRGRCAPQKLHRCRPNVAEIFLARHADRLPRCSANGSSNAGRRPAPARPGAASRCSAKSSFWNWRDFDNRYLLISHQRFERKCPRFSFPPSARTAASSPMRRGTKFADGADVRKEAVESGASIAPRRLQGPGSAPPRGRRRSPGGRTLHEGLDHARTLRSRPNASSRPLHG